LEPGRRRQRQLLLVTATVPVTVHLCLLLCCLRVVVRLAAVVHPPLQAQSDLPATPLQPLQAVLWWVRALQFDQGLLLAPTGRAAAAVAIAVVLGAIAAVPSRGDAQKSPAPPPSRQRTAAAAAAGVLYEHLIPLVRAVEGAGHFSGWRWSTATKARMLG